MTHFEQDLASLKEKLLTMASRADSAVSRGIRALVDRDDDLARAVIEDDSILDEFEKEIDVMAITLLSKAPLAKDLRFITVAMKVSQNLERVGDEATTVCRRALELSQEPQLKPYVDIQRMAQTGLEMLRDAIDAFVTGDAEKARAIVPRDKEVDAINRQLHRELASYMIEKPTTITRALNLMVVSKSLERIADHATNIAEEVVYLFKAEDIRHLGKGKNGSSNS